jgi:hypothetical protein
VVEGIAEDGKIEHELGVETIEGEFVDDVGTEECEYDEVAYDVPVVPEPGGVDVPLLQLHEAVSLLPLHDLFVVFVAA